MFEYWNYQNLCKWFILSYEALKSLISVIFAHMAPDRSFDLQGCETRMTAICLKVNTGRQTNQAED